MKLNRVMLSFTGTKTEIYSKLKKLCQDNNVSMNSFVIDIINKQINKKIALPQQGRSRKGDSRENS